MTKTPLYTLLTTSLLASNALARPHCGCVEPTIGIGLDLTAEYGLASAKFPNGSIIDIGRIEAPEAFTTFYNSEPEPPTFAPCEPYSGRLSLRKIFQGIHNFIVRGGERPICQTEPSLAPLTDFLAQLKDLVETAIFSSEEDPANHYPKKITITSANLPVINLGDVAVDGGFRWGSTVSELQAAYHAIDGVSPGSDDELVLAIRFSDQGLDVLTATFSNGVFVSETPTSGDEDPPLPHHIVMGCNRKAQAAAVLESKIKGAMPADEDDQEGEKREIRKVVLLGGKSDDETFREGLYIALERLGINSETYEMLKDETFDSTYGAARGAASLGMLAGNCGSVVKIVLLPPTEEGDAGENGEVEGDTIEIDLVVKTEEFPDREKEVDDVEEIGRVVEDELKV